MAQFFKKKATRSQLIFDVIFRLSRGDNQPTLPLRLSVPPARALSSQPRRVHLHGERGRKRI